MREGMNVQKYQDLVVWQKSIQLVKLVYFLVKKLPKEETYALSDQMRRAAVSIPSNIAEGNERQSTKEYVHYLSIAKGSKAELQTQLLICVEIGYLAETDIKETMELCEEISKILSTIINKLTPDP